MLNSLQWRQHKHKAREARVVRVPREERRRRISVSCEVAVLHI